MLKWLDGKNRKFKSYADLVDAIDQLREDISRGKVTLPAQREVKAKGAHAGFVSYRATEDEDLESFTRNAVIVDIEEFTSLDASTRQVELDPAEKHLRLALGRHCEWENGKVYYMGIDIIPDLLNAFDTD